MVDGRRVFIDGDTGYFCEETELTKKIIEMLPCTFEYACEKLSCDYTVEEIKHEYEERKVRAQQKQVALTMRI